MKFFNIDSHISVIEDLKTIFNNLGHEVDSLSISDHNWIFGRNPSSVEVINKNNWQNLDKNLCDRFFESYKNKLIEYDGFICTYPPSFSMLFERFNKPIILQIPIRYETPFFNDPNKWNEFNKFLQRNIDIGKVIPVANSEYDKKYFEFFVKRECELIPNICDYTNTNWNPTKNKFLYSGRLSVNFDENIVDDRSKLHMYKWSDISSYNGIIIIPYNCSTMSIFEHYTANIPLFCPSKIFMKHLYSKHNDSVLSELTWNKTKNLKQGSSIDCDREKDPNMYNDVEIMSKWIELSDFYNIDWMPHIVYFDSFEDLKQKMKTTNLEEVSNNMREFNIIRKQKIHDKWNNILERV